MKKILFLFIIVVAVATYIISTPKPVEETSGTPEVPLGVEHAVTIAYSGSKLMVKPYKFGVPVNLRIANIIEKDDVTTYDIRYMLNVGGEYDIMEYLMTEKGEDLVGAPEFKVKGLEKLSQTMETRISEVESMEIQIWHYYYEVMYAVIAAWIFWLLLIIFWKREKEEEQIVVAPPKSFQESLSEYIQLIENKKLDDAKKAEMEMLVINWWKDQLEDKELAMIDAVRRIESNAQTSSAYQTLEQWIHNPNSDISTATLVETLKPYTQKRESVHS